MNGSANSLPPRIFDDRRCGLGEGPLWHPERDELFWVDIPKQKLMARGPDGARERHFDEMISALGWIDRDTLLLASETGLYRLAIADWARTPICPIEADNSATRSNDGRGDPWGGFWVGTMGKKADPEAGAIYRLYRGELRRLVERMTIPNGLCFDRARQIAYYTDSALRKTWRLALDGDGWPVGDPELFLDYSGCVTTIDGAIIDRVGHLWCAIFDGSAVLRISPEGKLVERFDTRTPRTTCPAFGGSDFSDLFVTTAAIGLNARSGDAVPHGTTLCFPGVAHGVAEPRFVVDAL